MNENNIAKIDLNLLKSLRALLEENHVGRAAEKMNVSQSAMSHTLTRLRKVFDDPLFVRTAKGLEPTDRALELDGKLRFILDEIDILLTPPDFDISRVQYRFRIQTHDFLVAAYLSDAFRTINKLAPDIVFDIQTLDNNGYQKLDNGELDMIIGTGLQAKPKLRQKRLAEEKLVCLLDKHHPALNNWNSASVFQSPHIKSSLIPERDDPVSQYANTEVGSTKDSENRKVPRRNIGLYTETLSQQLPLISGTEFIGFLPESLAGQGEQFYGLAIKPSPFPLPDIMIRSIWHERHQNHPVHKWIRDKISEVFEQKRD
ncbi:LysR family transcriptional regulator [Photobacterium sp. J15]|uniref:LysR family transcriptional regulator n=1 Tax=Photobacterium sp. J15 TaxID=265901 RepID=UPI0007E2EE9A|nr:LysR family transcriptional regulator [Photobacterium sp. J15]